MMPGLGGVDPRQMAMMMRKLGIDVKELDDVQEVVVRTASKEYRFRRPTVSVMKAQGTETWQVQGKAEVVERAGAAPSSPAPAASSSPAVAASPVEIPEEDVRLVAKEAKVDLATARKTLQATNGDIAEAIVRLAK